MAKGIASLQISEDLSSRYQIPLQTAQQDVSATLANWSAKLLAPDLSVQPSLTSLHLPANFSPTYSGNYSLNGNFFRLHLEGEELIAEIAPRLETLRTPSATPDFTLSVLNRSGSNSLVFRDHECIASEELTSGARAVLLQEITRLSKAGRDWSAILHAGACGNASSAILLAGGSHSGKTTLCAALMASGLTFYSDDSAALDQHFRVAAMPFSLMLREGSWPLLQDRFPEFARAATSDRWGVNVRFLSPHPPSHESPAVPVRALVFVAYQPGAATNLQPIEAFESLLALQQSGFWVPHTREAIASFLEWLTQLPRYQLSYSNLEEATEVIKEYRLPKSAQNCS